MKRRNVGKISPVQLRRNWNTNESRINDVNAKNSPEKIVELIQQYYKTSPPYQGNKDYTTFTRYDKSDAGVSTQPWLNKEVFVKIYSKFEGRNLDNKHPHPYVSIQVRYDRDLNEKVTYSWEKAVKNYHRK